ncbi:hypothetical protein [Pandoraea sputorum]|uniref:DUF2946 domain-containing protein n=1 Tax=Pandoraea sputorum TaxID=93222 RepID=A0A239SIQ4_9BURK|nr:hypothetical protein [Pandoraea sputorum]APD12432.1 hypothetical protein NA29_25470 [Pandoraea sputorum]SNU85102.1 Uncharacterised protein [Pandoraea sputorum]VVD82787.1 hypothetical protein PSP20601_01195 [Pandoraea sputorum]
MHRRWLPFWLIVCVLVSQMALARHVVFHTASALAATSVAAVEPADAQRQHGDVGRSGGNGRTGQRSDDADAVCEQCLAFIAVDVALPALPVFASLPPLREWHYPPVAPVHVRSVLRGPTRNRDPPHPSVSFA